jgi:hypothetical protein
MNLNIKILKSVILDNASFVRSYDKSPTQNFFINYICCFPVGSSICKPLAVPTFEQATYVKYTPLLKLSPFLLRTELELTDYHTEN